MTQDEILLFANEKAFDAAVRTSLEKDGVVLKPYNDIYRYVKPFRRTEPFFFPEKAQTAVWSAAFRKV